MLGGSVFILKGTPRGSSQRGDFAVIPKKNCIFFKNQ
jgi:hypothetical protein